MSIQVCLGIKIFLESFDVLNSTRGHLSLPLEIKEELIYYKYIAIKGRRTGVRLRKGGKEDGRKEAREDGYMGGREEERTGVR